MQHHLGFITRLSEQGIPKCSALQTFTSLNHQHWWNRAASLHWQCYSRRKILTLILHAESPTTALLDHQVIHLHFSACYWEWSPSPGHQTTSEIFSPVVTLPGIKGKCTDSGRFFPRFPDDGRAADSSELCNFLGVWYKATTIMPSWAQREGENCQYWPRLLFGLLVGLGTGLYFGGRKSKL